MNPSFAENEGQFLVIILGLDANPDPGMFQWYFNGQPLNQTSEISFNVSAIVFNPLRREYGGTYTVEASNLAGSGNASFEVEVYCKFGEQFFLALRGQLSHICDLQLPRPY